MIFRFFQISQIILALSYLTCQFFIFNFIFKKIYQKQKNKSKTIILIAIVSVTLFFINLLSVFSILYSNTISKLYSYGGNFLKKIAFFLQVFPFFSLIPVIYLIVKKIYSLVKNSEKKKKTKNGEKRINMSRRRFLKNTIGTTLSVFPLVTIASTIIETEKIELTNISLPMPNLPKGFDNFKIVHISDIHSSYVVRQEYLQNVVSTINKIEYDLLVITGDFVTASLKYLVNFERTFDKIKHKTKSFAVPGNHDYINNGIEIENCLNNIGVRYLKNENISLLRNGSKLNLIGLEDIWKYADDIDKAMLGCSKEEFNLLLCHNPDFIVKAKNRNINLMLSGHTHGGQIRLPLLGAPVVPSRYGNKYAYGLFREIDTYMYVTKGIGVGVFPFRFMCRPEITVLTLKKEAEKI